MIGTYYKGNFLQERFIENLIVARSVLAQFKSLNDLLDEFEGYENKSYDKIGNVIMRLCLPIVKNGLDNNNIKKLDQLEKAIQMFDCLSWCGETLNHFKSRIASEDVIQSLSVVTELEVAFALVSRFDRPNVSLYSKLATGGFSDLSVLVNGKSVYIEIGNLGTSIPEVKIQKILDESAKYLCKKIAEKCYLMLMVDTSELVFGEKDRIEVKPSIERLRYEIDILQIHKLAGFKGSLHFDEISDIMTNRALYEKFQKYLSQRDEELIKLLAEPIIENWATSISPSILAQIRLVKSIFGNQRVKDTLVEIHTEQVFPSKAAHAEIGSFLNHIVRNIETQISEKQLQPKGFNIIAVKGFNWLLFPFEADQLHPLFDTLHKFFEETRQPYLSGVAVSLETIDEGVYVSNPYAEESSTLKKADITQLGFTWLEF
jgi:hypothetical protein